LLLGRSISSRRGPQACRLERKPRVGSDWHGVDAASTLSACAFFIDRSAVHHRICRSGRELAISCNYFSISFQDSKNATGAKCCHNSVIRGSFCSAALRNEPEYSIPWIDLDDRSPFHALFRSFCLLLSKMAPE